MKIEIVTKNVKDESVVREYIQRKVHGALDRLDDRIRSVTVRLQDETRDSNAFDGLCTIEVELSPKGHIHVSSHGESAFDSVQQATQKMENAVKHDLDRHRNSANVRHRNNKREILESMSESGVDHDTE